jgi:hypothetical protein
VPTARVFVFEVINNVPVVMRELREVDSSSVAWIAPPGFLTVATGGGAFDTFVASVSPLTKFFSLLQIAK